MRTQSLALLILAVSALAACQKQGGATATPKTTEAAGDAAAQVAFAYADHNEDGAVDFEEYRNRSVKVFETADVNQDGSLSVDEQKAIAGPEAKVGDKPVTIQDFNGALHAYFDGADANKDHHLSPEEWKDAPRLSKGLEQK